MRFFEFKNPFSSAPTLSVPNGRQGPEVADIQKVLLALGYSLPDHGVDGVRGPETSAAVKQFQQDNNLLVDGDPGPETVAALNKIIDSNGIKFTKSTEADVKSRVSGADVDTSAIQDADFNTKLNKVADALGVESSALLAIMKQESGVNPKAVNKFSGASGLIQFMPDTARNLGTTVEAIRQMDAVEQLDYVYKYFKMVGVKPGMSLGDLYLAVFMPSALGKGDNHVLGQEGAPGFSGKVYAQNAGLDRNKDGIITVADAKQSVSRFA